MSASTTGKRQLRAINKRDRVIDAAIAVLASHGVARVTHRLIAKTAGTSLASTTYHFASKADIIAAAAAALLARYSDAFARAEARLGGAAGQSDCFRLFARRVLHNALGRYRQSTTAWAEIILHAVRHDANLVLSRQWNSQLVGVWTKIAKALGERQPQNAARSGIDLVMGLLFFSMALGLGDDEIQDVLDGGDLEEAWKHLAAADTPALPAGSGDKASKMREQLLAIAISILIEKGAEGISYRAIAEKAGLSAAAPTYYFESMSDLLAQAQAALFDRSKERYRAAMRSMNGMLDWSGVVDLTASVLIREATEYAGESLATFSIWIEAARRPELRPMIWKSFLDQHRAWHRLLTELGSPESSRTRDPVLIQALFVGKLLRILSTGSEIESLALIRSELAHDMRHISNGTFWAQ